MMQNPQKKINKIIFKKEEKKFGVRRFLHKLISPASKLIKKCRFLYTAYKERRDNVSKSHPTVGQSQQKVAQAMLHKRNTGYLQRIRDGAHSRLGTDNQPILR